MEKSCLVKIVGVGLLGVFCLPVIAQAQGGLVKAGSQAVSKTGFSAACKEAGCPLIKMIEESSGKINKASPRELNKAISEASRLTKVSAEVSKINIPNKIVVEESAKEFQAPGNAPQSLDQVKNTATSVQKPAQVSAATQKITDLGTVGEYYSLGNNAVKQHPMFAGEMSQKIATFNAKMGRYYQNKLEWELWNAFFKETASKEMSFFDSFPKTLAEQQAFLDRFLDNQTEEVKLLFSNSSFNTTTKAQIAWVAGDGERAYKKVSVEEIENLFYKANTQVTHYQNLLAESYAVDPRAEVALEFVAADYHLSLTQVEDLIRAVDLRTEKIAHLSESELDVLLRQEAQNITRTAQLSQVRAAKALNSWEKSSNYTRTQVFNFHQTSVLREVIDRAHLNLAQSEQLFTYAANAITRWDPDGSSIDNLLKMMEDSALLGNPPSAEEALELAQSVFKAW